MNWKKKVGKNQNKINYNQSNLNLEKSSVTNNEVKLLREVTDLKKQNKELLGKLNISDIHVFPYSIRPATTAYHLKNKVHPSTITSRAKEIREIAKDLKIYPMRLSKYCITTMQMDDSVKKNRFKEKQLFINKILQE